MEVPTTRSAYPKVGEKCTLIAYESRQRFLDRDFSADSGSFLEISEVPGKERALYTLSSISGLCGAPVVNTDGKVVGFHNFTAGHVTGCVPVTAHIVNSASGQDFQTAPSQA
jgi:hypothetical protein